MRAAEGRQRPAVLEQLEGAEVNLLIPAQRVGHRSAVAREGRRVEHNQIPAGNRFLVRLRDRLGLEPIEDVYRFGGTLLRHAIGSRVARGGSNHLSALVEQMYVGGSGASGVQPEPAQEAEAIQHLRALRDRKS